MPQPELSALVGIRELVEKLSDLTRLQELWAGGQPYPDPQETQFNGSFFVLGAHCAVLEAWIERRMDPLQFALGFGTDGQRCPAEPAP